MSTISSYSLTSSSSYSSSSSQSGDENPIPLTSSVIHIDSEPLDNEFELLPSSESLINYSATSSDSSSTNSRDLFTIGLVIMSIASLVLAYGFPSSYIGFFISISLCVLSGITLDISMNKGNPCKGIPPIISTIAMLAGLFPCTHYVLPPG